MGQIRNPSVIEAVQEAAHNYGHKEIASLLDKRPSTLYSELNPWGQEQAKLGLDDAIEIMRITEDVTALEKIAQMLGYALKSLKEIEPDKSCWEAEHAQDSQKMGEMVRLMDVRSTPAIVQAAATRLIRDIEETVVQYARDFEEKKK